MAYRRGRRGYGRRSSFRRYGRRGGRRRSMTVVYIPRLKRRGRRRY